METVANSAQVDQGSGEIVLRHGGRHKPEIRIEQLNGSRVTVKDFSPCGRWFRWLFGRWLVTRECSAYRAASGIAGVPELVDRLGPYALAIEYIDGQPCTELRHDGLPADFWEQLGRIIGQLHEHGVAHGDLKTFENVLIGRDGRVYLTDFSSAILPRTSLLHRLVFPFVRDDDQRAIIKIKLGLAPDTVSDDEHRFLNERPLVERVFRWFRVPLRMLIKRLGGPSSGEEANGPAVEADADPKV